MNEIVFDLTEPYSNLMLNPPLRGTDGICPICFTFTNGYPTCVQCRNSNSVITSAVLPVTYSIHMGQVHEALYQYKRSSSVAVRNKFRDDVAAIIYRFLDRHESCLAAEAGVDCFEAVTIVPSSSSAASSSHALDHIVGSIIPATRDRYVSALSRTSEVIPKRTFSDKMFTATADVAGKAVLLIDDTWTSGASAQSAANALLVAGATDVAIAAVGRHVRPDFMNNERELKALPTPFDWDTCGLHRH